MLILDKLLPFIFIYIRPFIKWFLHTFTRLCELQRLCYGAKSGASRTKQVERSLNLSKNHEIKCMLRELDETVEHCNDEELKSLVERAVNVVCRAKHIKPRCHPDFPSLFGCCVMQIYSYKQLLHIVENKRAEQYDSENIDHEQKLLQLWSLLMPDVKLTGRITRQWQDIGFQGDDPKTDFRGMGLLGLENLLFFALEHNDAAQHVLLHSRHPRLGYTFAIVGINLTALAYRLLKSGNAKTHFYNLSQSLKQPCSIRQFHQFYCYLLFEFDRFWMESEPRDIMDFREIYQNFEITIMETLHNNATIFRTNLVVESV